MVVIVKLEMTGKEYEELAKFLKFHEDDIATSMNDFGDLRELFVCVFDTEPKGH